MSLQEIIGRIRASGAEAALVVSQYKGNPGNIKILLPDGTLSSTLYLESAMLRREVAGLSNLKIRGVQGVYLSSSATDQTRRIAVQLSTLLSVEVFTVEEPVPLGPSGHGMIQVHLDDLPHGQTLWTCYHAEDMQETGPRIRLRYRQENQKID